MAERRGINTQVSDFSGDLKIMCSVLTQSFRAGPKLSLSVVFPGLIADHTHSLLCLLVSLPCSAYSVFFTSKIICLPWNPCLSANSEETQINSLSTMGSVHNEPNVNIRSTPTFFWHVWLLKDGYHKKDK